MNERWKPIKGYEGRYEVSDRGRVRSLNYSHTGCVQLLKQSTDPQGYKKVDLCAHNIARTTSVHSLDLESFIGPRPKRLVCDHIDSNPSNNRMENLEWVTSKENTQRGRTAEAARKIYGVLVNTAKLNEAKVKSIRRKRSAGATFQSLGDEYGVDKKTIWYATNGVTWKHVA